MGKLVLWLAVIGAAWLGWSVWRLARRRAEAERAADAEEAKRASASSSAGQPARDGATGSPEPMVSCAHCRLYLPRRDAVIEGTRAFCSTAHRDAGPRNGSDSR